MTFITIGQAGAQQQESYLYQVQFYRHDSIDTFLNKSCDLKQCVERWNSGGPISPLTWYDIDLNSVQIS